MVGLYRHSLTAPSTVPLLAMQQQPHPQLRPHLPHNSLLLFGHSASLHSLSFLSTLVNSVEDSTMIYSLSMIDAVSMIDALVTTTMRWVFHDTEQSSQASTTPWHPASAVVAMVTFQRLHSVCYLYPVCLPYLLPSNPALQVRPGSSWTACLNFQAWI